MITNPFAKCLKPKVVLNKYTGKKVVVKCGKCEACLNAKSANYTQRCQLESKSHFYRYFISLTYNRFSVPLCKIQFNEKTDLYDVIAITPRINKDLKSIGQSSIIAEISADEVDEMIIPKQNIHPSCKGNIPFLYKRDIQLFLKRLRKYIKNEKIRFFLCGEYGTDKLRCHYHLILWFEEEQTAKDLRKNLRKAWPFGRIDCQASRDETASYVASYVNSLSHLPSLYSHIGLRPFMVHSKWLGNKVVEEYYSVQQVNETFTAGPNQVSIPLNGKYRDVILWRSLENIFMPKCKGFSEKSDNECLFAYRTYEKILIWTGETSAYRQAHIIAQSALELVFGTKFPDPIEDVIYYFSKSVRFDYLYKLYHYIDPMNFEYKDWSFYKAEYMRVVQSVYRELYISKLFYQLKQKKQTDSYSLFQYLKIYYSNVESWNYKKQITEYESFLLNHFSTDCYHYFFPDTFVEEDFLNEKFYDVYKNDSIILAENKVKNKKLNDKNDVVKWHR